MEKGKSLNGLGYGMKCFVAAETAMNSNFGDLSARNGSIDTMNIMTLSDYLNKEKMMRGKLPNPELTDDNKLMRTYVIPMTMPNGERIDVIVNSKGNDIAQIYVNESPENRFHLDKNIVDKIRIMTMGAIDQKSRYKEEFVPDDLEDLARKISKDELIPKTTDNVERRKKQADEKSLEDNGKEQENEQKEKTQKTPEEIAAEAGVELSVLEKFCKDNGISIDNIKGIQRLKNTEGFEDSLDEDLDIPEGEEIIALRVDGVDGKINATLGLMDTDGATLDFDGKHDELLDELVPEGAEGNGILETDEALDKDIELKDENGKIREYDLDNRFGRENRQANMEYFTQRYNKIKETVESARAGIENDDSLSNAEKARMIAELEANEYGQLERLQNETGIQIPEISREERADAEHAEYVATKEELKENSGKVIGAIGTAAAIGALVHGGELFKKNKEENEDDGRDPRESGHKNDPRWEQD